MTGECSNVPIKGNECPNHGNESPTLEIMVMLPYSAQTASSQLSKIAIVQEVFTAYLSVLSEFFC